MSKANVLLSYYGATLLFLLLDVLFNISIRIAPIVPMEGCLQQTLLTSLALGLHIVVDDARFKEPGLCPRFVADDAIQCSCVFIHSLSDKIGMGFASWAEVRSAEAESLSVACFFNLLP